MSAVLMDDRRAWWAASAAVGAWAGRPVAESVGVRRRHGGEERSLCRLGRQDALIRKMAIYVCVCGLGLRINAVAGVCGLRHGTCGPFVRQVEDLRDDPAIDALLDRLTAEAMVLLEQRAAA